VPQLQADEIAGRKQRNNAAEMKTGILIVIAVTKPLLLALQHISPYE
jgi:hypothetical protein